MKVREVLEQLYKNAYQDGADNRWFMTTRVLNAIKEMEFEEEFQHIQDMLKNK